MKISVVITCFNDGEFLPDAVESVLSYSGSDLELIIVDDGSTDLPTLNLLKKYREDGMHVISHPNKGLAYSRNVGIQQACGKYILPLDADNKIKEAYITQAIQFLDTNDYDIVYSRPLFFGEDLSSRKFETHDFDGEKLFATNFIDACAVFRKSTWESVGGFDESMPFQGNEDWEFWLHCHIKGFRFKYLNEELFEYRIKAISMISEISGDGLAANKNYIISKHIDRYRSHIEKLEVYRLFYLNDQKNHLRTSIKYLAKCFRLSNN